MGPQAIGTGVYGPLPQGCVGLLLGRSSTTMQGLQVLPGIIDSDYTGEIKIMVQTTRNIITLHPEKHIAQLILLPVILMGKPLSRIRGNQGFGSSDMAYWLEKITHKRPRRKLLVNGKEFDGLLDTGADVSVISSLFWPQHWPLVTSESGLQGIGYRAAPQRSASPLTWEDPPERMRGQFRPYVLPGIPSNLWGRDILEGMGVRMYSLNPAPPEDPYPIQPSTPSPSRKRRPSSSAPYPLPPSRQVATDEVDAALEPPFLQGP